MFYQKRCNMPKGEYPHMRTLLILLICLGFLVMPSAIVNSQESVEDEKIVPVCHDGETTLVPEADLQEYLDSGATQGACPTASAPTSKGYSDQSGKQKEADKEDDKEENIPQEKVIICHKGWLTLSVAKAAVPAHLKHGDTLGACPDSSKKKGDLKKTEDKDSEEEKPKKKESTSEKTEQNKGKGKGKQK
jgi:hypothetical protein